MLVVQVQETPSLSVINPSIIRGLEMRAVFAEHRQFIGVRFGVHGSATSMLPKAIRQVAVIDTVAAKIYFRFPK